MAKVKPVTSAWIVGLPTTEDQVDQNVQRRVNAVAKKRDSGSAAFWRRLDRNIVAWEVKKN